MLRHALHEFEAVIKLTAVSPLLVKDGRIPTEAAEREKLVSDKRDREQMPVALPISRNSRDDIVKALINRVDPLAAAGQLDFYIPGSSMKGAWRSHLERVLRGLTTEEDARVCDPLDDDGVEVDKMQVGRCSACSEVLIQKKKLYTEGKKKFVFPAYAMSCPICRMFGNTTIASRVKISDGERKVKGRLIQREHVAINRKNGQVMRGPFKYFALQDSEFEVTVTLRNYELQHLVLLAVLFSDLGGMRVPLGSGKSKGYGQVQAVLQGLKFTAFGLECPDGPLSGLAEHPLCGTQLADEYRWTSAEKRPQLTGFVQDEIAPWRWQRKLKVQEFFELVKGIPLRWDKVAKLEQRMAWEPGRAPA
jgi:CRISPR/Cas system CSM-associated protein Csm3 (group 7 of RAMP superfamily)